jgi:D-alanyl-D-alanine carboxypeptidase/D-alanyl-D-alanine-endopeptidase (penicillin-binding protein 4)
LPPGTRIQNGSGLFDSNRLAASTLTRVLELGWTHPRLMPEYTAQFAIGGTDGTLRNRFARWKDSHAVRAKTGTLDDVIALAGYLMREHRAPIAFAIEVNGIRGQHAELRNRIDAIVDKLAKE